MNTIPLIEARAVNFKYENNVQVLFDVNLQVRQGDFVALLAANGSGKTTLIKTLAGLLTPESGQVLVNGKAINGYTQSELYQRVGLVFQNPNDQLFAATVEEDVAFGPRNLNLSEEEVKRRVDEALEILGVSALRKRPIHHASFGEQKRIAIAGVLAMRPSVMILDEPTAGLDPEGELMMVSLLRNLNRKSGMTIILATHSVDTVPMVADRICVLNCGRLVRDGTPHQIFSNLELIRTCRLRLPYVTSLVDDLRRLDGVPANGLPLTVAEARECLLEAFERKPQPCEL
jgi:cobalt/nickel transport system ATP-binding protein